MAGTTRCASRPRAGEFRLGKESLRAWGAPFTDRKMRHVPQRNIQFASRMPALPFPDECAFLRQVRKVTCRCRRRCLRDGAVLAGAHAALESLISLLLLAASSAA